MDINQIASGLTVGAGLDMVCYHGNSVLDSEGVLLGSKYPCDLNATSVASLCIAGGLLLLLIGIAFNFVVKSWPTGDEGQQYGLRMNRIGDLLQNGIKSFFFRISAGIMAFMMVWFILFLIVYSALSDNDGSDGIRYASAYFVGIVFTLPFIFLAMSLIGHSIVRTARQATLDMSGLPASLRTAFGGGVGATYLILAALLSFFSLWYLLMTLGRDFTKFDLYGTNCNDAGTYCGQAMGIQSMVAFGVGVSTLAFLFRSVGGIFAKAAEIGSEIVWRREVESDAADKLRNPATIADKIGAIVVDSSAVILDMGETMILAMLAVGTMAGGDVPKLMLAFWLPVGSLFAGLIGWVLVRCNSTSDNIVDRNNTVLWGFRAGLYATVVSIFIFSAVVVGIIYTDLDEHFGGADEGWKMFGCHLLGLIAAVVLWESTAFFTSHRWFPTRSVTAAGLTGPATFFVQGLGVAMLSVIPPFFILTICIVCANSVAGNYGIGIAALGFWSIAGWALPACCVSPVAYGADDSLDAPDIQGARENSVPLVMAGESAAAETRGWSIGAAVITAFAVMGAFDQEAQLKVGGTLGIDYIGDGLVFGAAVCGALSIVIYAGINTLAVGKATRSVYDETIRQFKENTAQECDPASMVKAAIYPAIMGCLLPMFYVFLFPATVGFLFGPRALLGFVVGAILAGAALAFLFCNAGASWAKAKTAIEAENLYGGPGEEAHLASVAGARAGGPLKDVAAPTIITAMKSMAIISLILAPTIKVGVEREDIQECLNKFLEGTANMYVRSWEHCFDWNRPYWFILPAFLLGVVSAFFYILFWRLDGTSEGKPATAVVEDDGTPQMTAYQVPMVSQPQLVQYVPQPMMQQAPPPALLAPQTTQIFQAPPQFAPQMRMAPPEPMVAAPMRPEPSSVDNFIAGGYQVAQN
mmetsp:Transcript_27418/g.56136  ORF Transcript_27418/g.56136 Transcript_27418/m.56136 type:complete len:923 (-) Transcript_27418:111-2879(-)|eukprot:CAMPEP_0181316336 /NCGR_PEP_ID=MMETSP1101-20121128/15839_1 /TAXON_ID=46948 /ORGANISM="Rhodomonas abbreviata, Strain Caron Lab Isolate" /LENGTH=922 /DNA_ID=CAMNT_0023423573 /DNA_START=137 /DNA_END=2905 /DNA_ORIENTATION=+